MENTKADLIAVLAELRAEWKADLAASEDRMKTTIRQMEANLRGESFLVDKSQHIRLRSIEKGDSVLTARLALAEERLFDMEKLCRPIV